MALTAIRSDSKDPGGEVLFVGRRTPTGTTGGSIATGSGWLLTFTLRGRRDYVARGVPLVATPGVLALFAPAAAAQRPGLQPKDWECVFVRFQPSPGWSPSSSFDRLADGVHRAQVSLPSTRRRIEEAFERLEADLRTRLATNAVGTLDDSRPGIARGQPLRAELMSLALAEIFLLIEEEPLVQLRLDPRVRQALELMASDLSRGHSVRSLGASCGLSPSRFAHLFQTELGISPVRALRRMRLREAALQLQYSEETIAWVAERAGFSSPSHLSREFRRQFGVSPRSYRTRFGG